MSDGGTIRTTWIFDASRGVQSATQMRAAIQGAQNASAGLSTAEARAALTAGKLATEEQKTAIAATNAARASQLLARDTALAAAAQDRAALSAQRRAAAEARAAQAPAAGIGTRGGLSILPRELTQFGPEALNQIKSGLLGVIGPAALVTTAFGAVSKAIDLTEESFKLKASLDQTTQSIDIQLRGVRQSGIVFADAGRFAAKYGLTQEETNQAIKASVGILRNSTASASDLLGVLARLQIASPEQGLEGAALAVKELAGGDIQSLVERFEISRASANKMKAEIQGGADAVTVLSKYLTDSGIGMEALEARTQGASGKMRELQQETERFKLALGGEAGGLGLTILETRIRSTSGATRVLTGDFQGMKEGGQSALQGLISTLESGNPVAAALGQAIDTLTGTTKSLSIAADSAAIGVLRSADADDRVAASAAAARPKIQALTGALLEQANATALADQRKGEQTGTDLSAAQFDKFANLSRARNNEIANEKKQTDEKAAQDVKRTADKAAADAERLSDLRVQNRLIKAKDSASKIAILQQQLAGTTDPIERQQLQNQVDQERLSTAKAHTSTLDKQLGLQEGIRDSVAQQAKAEADLRASRAQGVLDTIKENKELKTARAILGSANANAEFKQIAEANIALITANRDQRALREQELAATAGGTIVNGKLLQSVPGGGGSVPTAAGGVAPTPASAPTPATAGGGHAITLRLVDSGGRVIAESVEPFIMDSLMKGVQAVRISKGA